MAKEEYYNKIKNWLSNKLDNLRIIETSDGIIYLYKKNDDFPQFRIHKSSGLVCYYVGFANDLIKKIPIDILDFEIILVACIEDILQIKVTGIFPLPTVYDVDDKF